DSEIQGQGGAGVEGPGQLSYCWTRGSSRPWPDCCLTVRDSSPESVYQGDRDDFGVVFHRDILCDIYDFRANKSAQGRPVDQVSGPIQVSASTGRNPGGRPCPTWECFGAGARL